MRIAIVGAGPAGIYAAKALLDAEPAVSIDIFERLPAPFGLIRYGVAPDHPRVKGIIAALRQVLEKPQVQLLGNVEYGKDVDLPTLRHSYDGVIFATGADHDRDLGLPGAELVGSYGAAEFVSWYNGHPDAPRSWPLDAEKVAVFGVGNVALDVARVLAKPLDELLHTDIPDNVLEGLRASRVREIHIFGRRGPAQAKFSPLELRELGQSAGFDVIVDPADLQYDEASRRARTESKIVDAVAATLDSYARQPPRGHSLQDAAQREATPRAGGLRRSIHLHFLEAPVALIGARGRLVGVRTERMRLDGHGATVASGRLTDWSVGAAYRAIGYRSSALADLPFSTSTATVSNIEGRVVDAGGVPLAGVYVTGWIKRGPVGLIGHTKADALETVRHVLEDLRGRPALDRPTASEVLDRLNQAGVVTTTWEDWQRLDAHERALGGVQGRERIKVVAREDMIQTGVGARCDVQR